MAGLLLAGGQSRRMGGGDKSLRPIAGEPLIARVIARAKPQVETLLISANGDPSRFAAFGLPVVADAVPGHAGPLAGILAGLEWAKAHVGKASAPALDWVASFATDTPFFPPDLVSRLREAVDRSGADIALAASAGRRHPVFGLWPVRLAADLRAALVDEGVRKVEEWASRYRVTTAEFEARPFDPFFNANRPEDLAEAERLLSH